MASQSALPVNAAEAKGLIGSLFDFSFHSFLTSKLIRLLYMLAMFGAAMSSLSLIITGFDIGRTAGVIAVIVSPLFFLFSIGFSRVVLELIMVVFRIEELLAKGR